MANLRRMANQAKRVMDKRGGTENAKEDLAEVKEALKGEGSLKDKAKAAGEALKEPGRNASREGDGPPSAEVLPDSPAAEGPSNPPPSAA